MIGSAAFAAPAPSSAPQSQSAAPAPTQAAAVSEPAASAETAAVVPAAPQSKATPAFEALLSRKLDAHSTPYKVEKGDTFSAIAKKHGVTTDLVKLVNGIDDKRLRPGDTLKIPTYKFSILVSKSQNTLTLKGDEEVLKTYVVSTGTAGSTPAGTFKITDKLVDPVWYKDGRAIKPGSPKNQLGSRWMGIDKPGYGIHGTIEPETLGKQVTAGCVRMKNEEVEELYRIVAPGTPVTITD